MQKHLTFFELADPNAEEVDAVMSEAAFSPNRTQIGDIVDHDGLKCTVLQTYTYIGAADFELTMAIVYPSNLTPPEKDDWWCHSGKRMEAEAGRPYYQTRHIFVSARTSIVFDLSSVGAWDDDLAPTQADLSGSWKLNQCHAFTCADSPIPSLYVALCEKQSVLVAA